MRKSFLSAAALVMGAMAASAHAQSVIGNGDFELSSVPTGSSSSFADIVSSQTWDQLQWGSITNTSSIVDASGNQAAQVVLGDSIWSAFSATGAGTYALRFDAVGQGSYSLVNASTDTLLSSGTLSNAASTTVTSAGFALNTSDVYRVYFSSSDATNTLTVDNVMLAAVPEPQTYAMMLAGLGALGLIHRRRMAAQRG